MWSVTVISAIMSPCMLQIHTIAIVFQPEYIFTLKLVPGCSCISCLLEVKGDESVNKLLLFYASSQRNNIYNAKVSREQRWGGVFWPLTGVNLTSG